MAKIFRVVNLNPDFEIPAGSGFWFRANSTGDLFDDVPVSPVGMSNNGRPGIFVPITAADEATTIGDLLDVGTPLERFACATDFLVDDSDAVVMENALNDEVFTWLPKNPEYNTVAPYLKDGTTANPDFDNTGNPVLADGTTKASVTASLCKHFTVTVAAEAVA